MQIADYQAAEIAMDKVRALLDARQPAEAIAFAEACEGAQPLVTQVRALACTHGGTMLRDRGLIERGAALWRQAGGETHPGLGYNLSNAHLDLWDLAVAEHGFVVAIQDHRPNLHTARELLLTAAADEKVPLDTRVQALTNLGNSYDSLGRDADAIAAYDQALALDPAFGMALGNKALTLLGVAPLARQHVPALLSEAVDAFDSAIEDRDRVIRIGGLSALEHFEAGRARIKVSDAEPSNKPGHVHRPGFRYSDWQDPYLRWCAQHALFLHVSLGCLSESYEDLDPLFFEGVTAGLSGGEQRRVKDLVDAFNAVKQDLLAARYLLWLASGEESPIREHAAAMSQRAGFLDSLMYARWGVRTGIAVQAFAAATNVLDKVACLVHLYYRTRRKTTAVSFRYLWHRRTSKNKRDVMDPELSDQFADGGGNRGLMALCDLSCDLEIESPLNELVERRHTATHRFLTVHSMLLDSEEIETRWLDRVGWYELTEGAMRLLSTARAAIIYLARTIDIAEQATAEHREEKADGTDRRGFVPSMPLFRASTEHPDFE